MGQEIESSDFSEADYDAFAARLKEETELLGEMLSDDCQGTCFDDGSWVGGYELETWLVDADGMPAASNGEFLNHLGSEDAVAELARFNVEFNAPPSRLTGNLLSHMQVQLEQLWQSGQQVAEGLDTSLLATGILPTVEQRDLVLANMSDSTRYQALNQQVLRLREGRAIHLDIKGSEHLQMTHHDVMLEAATTSFQIHLQFPHHLVARIYNASKIVSAPLIAASANSPFLFQYSLWDETRIPLFEQSVPVGASDYSQRVSFGVRYADESLFEIFDANLKRYPIMLPMLIDAKPEEFAHLRLHNGTIWRWNRPLIGFNRDGTPHLRIEQRVVPAGPTLSDQVANIAFYYGMVVAMAHMPDAPEKKLPFAASRDNFYAAARASLSASVNWLDGRQVGMQKLVLDELLPLASQGLEQLGIDQDDAEHYLSIVRERVASGQTGAAWQRQWVSEHGKEWRQLVLAYQERQQAGKPVHTWTLN
ncbi:glutamate--cysteine ligase [Solemya velum gill symbiont]|uniref:glutamate--cysteine ligase n=1 Tax=Solemya velum gill symbiont TaxID=2340 RepID=UPI000998C3A7|nr:glutamate--cysteine ligase [Solemya velum gill symbiont]OOY56108.1 glutamate--cysteine ligase [Solemya velum gill symbiont]OOY57351.1 glutamate--cysteine ligase [Solemya velum gill symbiont]OOY79223.1 glutamate--cysteine ligase [Solemya velum gill symbiont]OOY94447.1 glutamate--cysteine ligase [Solemya velum gill symbiont]